MNPFPGKILYEAPPPADSIVRFGWLGEAWKLFTARLRLWLGVMLILLSLSATATFATAMVGAAYDRSSGTDDTPFDWDVLLGGDFLIGAFYLLFTALLSAGILRIALRQVRGETVRIGDLFHGGARFWPLMGFWVLSVAAVSIGLGLCLIPGLLLTALLLPAPALIAGGDDVFQAIGRSLTGMYRGWAAAIGLLLVMSGLLALGLLPCGLGLFVTQPLFWLLIAVAARDVTRPRPRPPIIPPMAHFSPGAVWPPPPTLTPPPPPRPE